MREVRFAAMGTRIELHLFGAGDADALFEAQRAVEAVDDALTIHRPSPATALNELLASGGSVAVDDPLLLDALSGICEAWRQTAGHFDPTASAGQAGCWGDVRVDVAAARIEAEGPAALDFGGFGKGYALDRALSVLRRHGVRSALLSAGESSIAALGEHPLGGAWPIAVPDPVQPGCELILLEIVDQSMSVSATIGAGFMAPGRAAMVRASDGTVVTAPATAIAIDDSGALAEAISTALIVAPVAATQKLIRERPHGRHLFTHRGVPIVQAGAYGTPDL